MEGGVVMHWEGIQEAARLASAIVRVVLRLRGIA